MNGIFKTRSSNIWIHPITRISRYLILIKWLTSLRNKPCCVADLDGKQWAPLSSAESFLCPSPHALKMHTESRAQQQQHWPCFSTVVCASQGHTANPCVREIPSFNPLPWEGKTRVIVHDLEGDSLFYWQDRSWCLRVPSFRGSLLFFPFTWASCLCSTAASASSCPRSRGQYWPQVIQ